MSKGSVAVKIGGQEYRIKSDADESWLHEVASHVDATMERVRQRSGTVDTRDLAVLTALNLARELLALREDSVGPGRERLRALIALAESGLEGERSA